MKKLIASFLLVLTACATRMEAPADFRYKEIETTSYLLASWQKMTNPNAPVRIYIEGDGHAFNADGTISSNPTPKGIFLRQIAANDPRANVVYIARPCQYFQTEACSQKDWTTGRFSQKILDSTDIAVKSFMKKAKTEKIILVGYSGGATLGGLIAVRHPNQVLHFSSIAGVLNHDQWTEYHKDPPLTDSLNLADFRSLFLTIPQHHYVGAKDTVVPPVLTQAFMQSNDQITIIPEATHDSGYQKAIKEIYQEK